jgi:hypothetical protein
MPILDYIADYNTNVYTINPFFDGVCYKDRAGECNEIETRIMQLALPVTLLQWMQ